MNHERQRTEDTKLTKEGWPSNRADCNDRLRSEDKRKKGVRSLGDGQKKKEKGKKEGNKGGRVEGWNPA